MLVLLLLKQVSFAHAGRKIFGFNSFSRKNDVSYFYLCKLLNAEYFVSRMLS